VREERTPYGEYPQKVLTQIASGTAADLIVLEPAMNGDFLPSGQLLPVGDYLASSGVDMSKWNIDPMRELGFDGQLMGFPLQTSQDRIVHVNRELADADGLLDEAPLWGTDIYDTWDWDTLVEWAKAGTKITSGGDVEQYGLVVTNPPLKALIADLGGTLFDDDWNYDETVSLLDSEPVVEAVKRITDLTLVHKVAPLPGAEASVQGGSYVAGLAMSTFQWSTASIYPEENTFPQAYFQMPFIENKTHGLCPNYLTVNVESDDPELAMEWATTFTTDDDVRNLFFEVGSTPPAYDPLPIVEAAPEGTGKTIALIQLSRIEGMSTIPENAEGVVQYPGWSGRYASAFTQRAITTAMEQILLGDATPQEAMSEAKAAVDAEITEQRERARN